jgi:hypothetical protein
MDPNALEDPTKIDMITKRPRTLNTQYTVLTEEQLANIKKSGVRHKNPDRLTD